MQAIERSQTMKPYDSKKCNLPEPELEKVRELHWELSRAGFVVILKNVKEVRN